MTDRRLYPANERVAKSTLKSPPKGVRLTTGTPFQIGVEVADLCASPLGARDRQLLWGDDVLVLEVYERFAFVETQSGYVGYLLEQELRPVEDVTHFVTTAGTHAYTTENIKGTTRTALPFGAKLKVVNERKAFFETEAGFIPKSHLRSLDRPLTDPAAAAQIFFGVPYLWGGNSIRGVDCSGLISAAYQACGAVVPGDSDLQESTFGSTLAENATLTRGDIVFWSGHVGIMVDESVMLHANAHHMACRYEPLDQAKARIEAQGGGVVTARKRVI